MAERAAVLAAAHAEHPERFMRSVPRPAPLPVEVWINKPKKAASPDQPGQSDQSDRSRVRH